MTSPAEWLVFLDRDAHDLAERRAGQCEAAAMDCVRQIEVQRGGAVASVQRCGVRAAQLDADTVGKYVESLATARTVAEYVASTMPLRSKAGMTMDWDRWPGGLSPAGRWHSGAAAFVTAGLTIQKHWPPYHASDITARWHGEAAALYSASAVETLAEFEYRDDSYWRECAVRRANDAWATSARHDKQAAGCAALAEMVRWTKAALELLANTAQAQYDLCVESGQRVVGDWWVVKCRADADSALVGFQEDAEALQRGTPADTLPVRPQLPLE